MVVHFRELLPLCLKTRPTSPGARSAGLAMLLSYPTVPSSTLCSSLLACATQLQGGVTAPFCDTDSFYTSISTRSPSVLPLHFVDFLCRYYHPSPPTRTVEQERSFEGISLETPGSSSSRCCRCRASSCARSATPLPPRPPPRCAPPIAPLSHPSAQHQYHWSFLSPASSISRHSSVQR